MASYITNKVPTTIPVLAHDLHLGAGQVDALVEELAHPHPSRRALYQAQVALIRLVRLMRGEDVTE